MIHRFVVLLGSLIFLPALLQAKDRPNVVIFLADDQGWGDLSINGNTDLSTPNIDSLARDGALLDRFFVCPVCAPTRAEFLTGRYYGRTGVHGVSTGQERLNLDERTIAQVFQSSGYRTGAFGKWHNGMQHPYHPNARGFEEFYGFCSGHWGHYFDTQMDHNGRLVKGEGFIIDDLTNHAMEFIEAHKKDPFFCYLPYNTPHSPMQVPDEYWERFVKKELQMKNRDPEKEEDLHKRAALAMCENIDWNVGRVLSQLASLGLSENTIVIYFSDNGPNGWRWNGGMKGKKGDIDEGGVRSPFLIRWPGKIEAGKRVGEIAGAIDLLPTLTALCGVSLEPERPLDGRSLEPLLLGGEVASTTWSAREIVSLRSGGKRGPQISVRSQRFRLDSSGALFDMASDPGQNKDVSGENPEEVARLSAIAAQHAGEVTPVIEASRDRPYTVGYSEVTPLPARDGEGHGGVERSGRAPNCSFFTNWTHMDGSVTWDIEVGEAGMYEAILHQTCAAESVGTEMELSFKGQSVRRRVTEAWDPPLVGAEEDRSDRGSESLVKDFRPLSLGDIQLSKGRGVLTLRATEIPGKAAVDVRYVMLVKKSQR